MNFEMFFIANLIGSAAFALSGYLVGVRKNLDVMGLFIVAMLTANGGGAMRDILVNRTPSVLYDQWAFLLVVIVVVCAYLAKLHKRSGVENHAMLVTTDAIGLVAFSVTGTLIGIETELPLFGVMVLSFLTATGGGIIRDILVNETPALLSSDFYGTISLLVAISIFILNALDLQSSYSIPAVFTALLALRLVAFKRGWKLPKI